MVAHGTLNDCNLWKQGTNDYRLYGNMKAQAESPERDVFAKFEIQICVEGKLTCNI